MATVLIPTEVSLAPLSCASSAWNIVGQDALIVQALILLEPWSCHSHPLIKANLYTFICEGLLQVCHLSPPSLCYTVEGLRKGLPALRIRSFAVFLEGFGFGERIKRA